MNEFTIPIECPEGYEPVAFRKAIKGERYCTSTGQVYQAASNTSCAFLIVEKINPVTRTFRRVCENGVPEKGQYYTYKGRNHLKLCNSPSTFYGSAEVWEEVIDE